MSDPVQSPDDYAPNFPQGKTADRTQTDVVALIAKLRNWHESYYAEVGPVDELMAEFLTDVLAAANALESLLRSHPSAQVPEARDARQKRVTDWCMAAFGTEHTTNVEQRGLRMVEEAIEAAQAVGCDQRAVHALIDYIYGKPPGEIRQEIGGVQLCCLALASAAGFNADEAEIAEVDRVLSKPVEFFAARNRVKNDAGFVSGAYRQPLSASPQPQQSGGWQGGSAIPVLDSPVAKLMEIDQSSVFALADIAAERVRQIEGEEWECSHDDRHELGTLAKAAAAYALAGRGGPKPVFWPWDAEWWKPRSAHRNYVRAGALLVAELARHLRSAPHPAPDEGKT